MNFSRNIFILFIQIKLITTLKLKIMTKIEFVSYDGKYPCLCMGTLKIKVNRKLYSFNHAMISGGYICKDDDCNMWATQGDWEVDLSEHSELEPYKEEIARIVNENVEYGCCGGCI